MKLLPLLMFTVFSTSVAAEVYKCTDANGKTVYRPQACEEGFNNETINLKTGDTVNLDEAAKQALLKEQLEQATLDLQKQQQALEAQRQQALYQAAENESQINQTLIKENPTQYSAYAIPPYTPDKLPALVKNYASRLPEIERLRRFAAVHALDSGECGRVEAVELHAKSQPNSLVFLIDCSSAKSFYFTEQELPQ